jgi:nucleoside 2-deoxyribosyltransferase
MKIVICASIHFTAKIKEIANKLEGKGHEVEIPLTAQEIIADKLTLEKFRSEKKKNGDGSFRKINQNLIKRYYQIIKNADAVLVINEEKNGVKNYIGGNTLIEMAFAHVLGKPLYLLNEIPDMSYTDEIKAMQPIVILKKLDKIQFTKVDVN